jgi:hypothetical protein
MAGGFFQNSRLVSTKLPAVTKPVGGGSVTIPIPKIGFMHSLHLLMTATLTGTITAPNALGVSSVVKRVRVRTNSAIDIFNVSGPGYAYLVQEMLEREGWVATGQNQGRTVVSAAAFNLDMIVPIAFSLGNPLGVLMLQNESTVVECTIDFEADAVVGTGATVAVTVTPFLWYFTVPASQADYPPLNVLHTILQDEQAVAAAGDYTYTLPRAYVYAQVAHMLGAAAAAPADLFTNFRVRIGQSQFPYDWTPAEMTMLHWLTKGRARPLGTIFADYLAMSGEGNYGPMRDTINSALVTDLVHIIAATAAGTLTTVRRQLVPLA